MTPPSQRPRRIAVCAPGDPTEQERAAAETVGRLLADRGCTLVCGGLGGAMAAACRGAKAAGGTTIGILPGYEPAAANDWVDHVICTGLGQARNAVVAATAQAVIAVGGGFGTLSEIALGLRLRRPVVLLGGWTVALESDAARTEAVKSGSQIIIAPSPAEAVSRALAALDEREGTA